MTDRIADVWGERTPFGIGGHWPERADQFLAVGEDRVERWVQSACVLCSNGCGMDVAVAGGQVVGVRGRATDRVNRGRLGPKGLFGWQANHSPDRLTQPCIRMDGQLRQPGAVREGRQRGQAGVRQQVRVVEHGTRLAEAMGQLHSRGALSN